MPPKLSFDTVKASFEARGYLLLESLYIGKDVPMKYICPRHPNSELKICYNSLRCGNGCKYCATERTKAKLKLPFGKVVEAFEHVGYILLSTSSDYQNAQSKMKYRCPTHPNEQLAITIGNLKAGKRCKLCSRKTIVQKLTTPTEEVRALFEAKGFTMLDEEYGGKGKINFRCPNHPNKHNCITLAHLKNKTFGCPYCARLKVDYEDVMKEFITRNCELLEDRYVNVNTKMRFRCLFHPKKIYKITYDKFRSGFRGCHVCAGFHYATYDEVQQSFHEVGYTLLESEYHSSEVRLRYKCPHHPDKDTRMTYKKLKIGRRCPFCKNPYYTGEGDVKWKGGITNLNDLLRQCVEEWKKSVLRTHNFRCVVSGRGGTLDVHHASMPFYKLRDVVFDELGIKKRKKRHEFTDEDLKKIIELFIQKHQLIVGVPLYKSVHNLFHSIYGHDSSMDKLWIFKDRYLAGEFDHRKTNIIE